MTPLTRAQLAAIRAVLEVRLGWDHPLTQAVHEAHEASELPIQANSDHPAITERGNDNGQDSRP